MGIRERLERLLGKEQLPDQIDLQTVVFKEPRHGFEPGVYVKTNIPLEDWERNTQMIRDQVSFQLATDKELQQLLGEQESGVKIPLGEKIELDPNQGIRFVAVAYHRETGGVILKVERGSIGEAVTLINAPQVREALRGYTRTREI